MVIPEGTPKELVSVAKLAEKLKQGDQHNRDSAEGRESLAATSC